MVRFRFRRVKNIGNLEKKKKKKKKTIAFTTVRLLHIPRKKNFQNGPFWTRGKIDHQF